MEQRIMAIYDRKTEIYRFPNFVRSEGQALRALSQAVLDLETEIGKFPADFELYELARWDDERGTVIPHEKPVFVVSAQTIFNSIVRKEMAEEVVKNEA